MTDKIEIEVMRDTWVGEPGEAERIRKGTRMEVDISPTVLDGIESGAVRRVKPGDPLPKPKGGRK